MKRITLGNASLQKPRDDGDGNDDNDHKHNPGMPIDNLAVDVRIDKDDYKYVTIPLHQDFKLNNGQTLKIEKLEVMAYGNKLYFRVGEGERTVQGIKGGFTWESIGNEMQDAQFNVFEEESGYSIMLVPFFRITP